MFRLQAELQDALRARGERCIGRGKERIWSSEKEFMVDASELSGEEGRGKLRKATGRSKHPVIRG